MVVSFEVHQCSHKYINFIFLRRNKRSLPDSGNYQLESHISTFMWKLRCSQKGLHPFWELLSVIGRQNEDFLYCLSSQETAGLYGGDRP